MQSYKQIQKQIETLQRQAEKLRDQEVQGVVARIKVAIAHYGLTAEQLGFGGGSTPVRKPKNQSKAASTSAKYSDGKGNEWAGRGPRPHWLRDAIAAGRTLDEFSVGTTVPKQVASAKAAPKRKIAIRYRDDNGNTWTGRGSKPRWLAEALETGAALEQFAV